MGAPIRLVIAGHVDDGKSTLIGRLLADAGQVPDDQLARLAHDSRRFGTCGTDPDYALLLDGLQQEREQGITVDVAWRYFALQGQRFIVGDAPGHQQYTRNFATAASVADAAILLADARAGLTTQTRRHARILATFGVRTVALAVNKLDLAEDAPTAFARVDADWAALAAELNLHATAIPVIAREGGNLVHPHPALGWWNGPTLAAWLAALTPSIPDGSAPARTVVQHVARPDEATRMAQGFVAAGTLRPGDALTVQPGNARTRVARIAAPAGNRAQAATGDHVALVLDPPVDAPRGALLAADPPPDSADQFEAELLWAGDAPLVPGRAYGFQLHAAQATARIAPPRARICPDTGARLAADTLRTNDLGVVRVALDRRVAFAPFPENRTLGAFILTHPETRETVAAGTIRFALRRTQTIAWAEQSVTPAMRASLLAQRPRVAWLTGLSGSGKSTVADLADRRLHALGRPSIILDGDNLRHGLNRDLGFTEADRIENLRRAAEVAKLLSDGGLIVLAAFISPYAAERAAARALLGDRFVEVFLDTPLEVAEARDPKGLYARARRGEIANFTGISAPYEAPESPELRLPPSLSPEDAAERLVRRLLEE